MIKHKTFLPTKEIDVETIFDDWLKENQSVIILSHSYNDWFRISWDCRVQAISLIYDDNRPDTR